MSRTTRFRKGKDTYLIEQQWVLKQRVGGGRDRIISIIDPKSKLGIVLLARFHADMKAHVMIMNGPRWFNNLMSDRPHRRESKRQIHKFMLDPENFEVCLLNKPHKDYWW